MEAQSQRNKQQTAKSAADGSAAAADTKRVKKMGSLLPMLLRSSAGKYGRPAAAAAKIHVGRSFFLPHQTGWGGGAQQQQQKYAAATTAAAARQGKRDNTPSALSVLGYLVHFDPKKYPKL